MNKKLTTPLTDVFKDYYVFSRVDTTGKTYKTFDSTLYCFLKKQYQNLDFRNIIFTIDNNIEEDNEVSYYDEKNNFVLLNYETYANDIFFILAEIVEQKLIRYGRFPKPFKEIQECILNHERLSVEDYAYLIDNSGTRQGSLIFYRLFDYYYRNTIGINPQNETYAKPSHRFWNYRYMDFRFIEEDAHLKEKISTFFETIETMSESLEEISTNPLEYLLNYLFNDKEATCIK